MEYYDVLIASPGSSFHPAYIQSLTHTINKLHEKNLSVKWLNGQSSIVHHAREVTISPDSGNLDPSLTAPCEGLYDYKYLFWIDSDISWKWADFQALLNSPEDITCGAYLLADGQTTSVYDPDWLGGIPIWKILSLSDRIPVMSCGFGFLCVKKGVFEKIPRPWFAPVYAKVRVNKNGEDIIDALGEDISWCYKVKEANMTIWFDPTALVTHHKNIPIQFPPRP